MCVYHDIVLGIEKPDGITKPDVITKPENFSVWHSNHLILYSGCLKVATSTYMLLSIIGQSSRAIWQLW